MKLLTSQKNSLYDLIELNDSFTPSQFAVIDGANQFRIQYTNSEYYFKIQKVTSSWYIDFIPGSNTYQNSTSTSLWSEVAIHFRHWVENLNREISAPDKWDRLTQEMNNLRGIIPADNTMFSHSEYLILSQQISQIKSSIAAISLTSEQNFAIESKLDHLLALANDMNKFDWQGLFIGTIISIIIQLGVTQEHAQELLAIIKQVFSGYFL
ncbi:hypothetical protein N180_02880 [Pedobacter antarcticus 4BY]|uniref:Uncharacterized protein n=2 Tax=Pedobacter antarcticus TaxID=34086 RepID=A0A081PKI6_9SPHI|nr:hypothetical protein [Pedobacter antarcticus]KEQ31209.1 hypothetical protein N180_02880 [Pedobacter antarcticus 4BY]SFE55024.1 hypothetical protein SAMN03003324_00863 [Pedobacter antarcticus]